MYILLSFRNRYFFFSFFLFIIIILRIKLLWPGDKNRWINWKTFVCLTSYYYRFSDATELCGVPFFIICSLYRVCIRILNLIRLYFYFFKETHTYNNNGLWLNTIDRKWNELNWHHHQMKGICLNSVWILFKWKTNRKMFNIFIYNNWMKRQRRNTFLQTRNASTIQ